MGAGYGMSTMTTDRTPEAQKDQASHSGVYLPRPPLESSCRRELIFLECLNLSTARLPGWSLTTR